MPLKVLLAAVLSLWLSVSLAVIPAAGLTKQGGSAVSSGDIAAWGFGLVVVLGVFFACAWGVRKLGGYNVASDEKISMIGGLSLGLREKVIVLQIGKKQLVLGVTPGRIETLLVLEGDDCLTYGAPKAMTMAGFSQKLAQALKGGSNA
jgi:flagellar protein FliO/FliZ